MRSEKNELLQLLEGLAMLVAGLFIFSQKVTVSSLGYFSYGFTFGGFRMGNGLVMVPFIIGVVWMFGSGGSLLSKLFTTASVIFIIAAVVMNTNIYIARVTLYEWILILVLVFGGAGMLARLLFSNRKDRSRSVAEKMSDTQRKLDETDAKLKSVEDELEQLKEKI
ncbi:MAG: hypothetical protein LUE96_08220 [Lachnospiraceae bacterium]|nr:hypothetical protein [Lachnospiraceae bacterium]